jgi:hypothetical protein
MNLYKKVQIAYFQGAPASINQECNLYHDMEIRLLVMPCPEIELAIPAAVFRRIETFSISEI